MFPHVAGKFAGGALSPVTVAFFAKAGSQPPDLWVYVAATSETLVGVTLVLGICRPGSCPIGCRRPRRGLRPDVEHGWLRVSGIIVCLASPWKRGRRTSRRAAGQLVGSLKRMRDRPCTMRNHTAEALCASALGAALVLESWANSVLGRFRALGFRRMVLNQH
jgi:DoxX-like protein